MLRPADPTLLGHRRAIRRRHLVGVRRRPALRCPSGRFHQAGRLATGRLATGRLAMGHLATRRRSHQGTPCRLATLGHLAMGHLAMVHLATWLARVHQAMDPYSRLLARQQQRRSRSLEALGQTSRPPRSSSKGSISPRQQEERRRRIPLKDHSNARSHPLRDRLRLRRLPQPLGTGNLAGHHARVCEGVSLFAVFERRGMERRRPAAAGRGRWTPRGIGRGSLPQRAMSAPRNHRR